MQRISMNDLSLLSFCLQADDCVSCKLVFAEVKDLLQSPDIQKQIISEVESLCAELGAFASQVYVVHLIIFL